MYSSHDLVERPGRAVRKLLHRGAARHLLTLARRITSATKGTKAVSPACPVNADDVIAGLQGHQFFYLVTSKGRVLRLIVEEAESEVLDLVLSVAADLGVRYELRERISDRPISGIDEAHEILKSTTLLRIYLGQGSRAQRLEVLIERWSDRQGNGTLQGERANPHVSKLWKGNPVLEASRLGGVDLRRAVPADVHVAPGFDVDFVFSWVDSDDPAWQRRFAQFRPKKETDANSPARFRAKDDLKYALRSIERFAPWVRNVVVFTDCAPPEWIDLEQPGIRWVDFDQVFDPRHLPTFNSHAIEAYVHKIPGLTEHFVYSCDDYFLMRTAEKEDFFLSNGTPRVRLESFGTVNGPVQKDQPAYLNAARNSAECIYRDFGTYPTRLHTHSQNSLRRSILEEMEQRYPGEIERTRSSMFRGTKEVVMTGFFFAHYAIASGSGVEAKTPTMLIQPNHDYVERMRIVQSQIETCGDSEYLSVCLNDGNGSHLNLEWDQAIMSFLSAVFPEKSRYEK